MNDDTYRMLVISMISLSRLMDGGPAMFIVVKINQRRDIEGTRLSNPLVRNILRVCVVSYVILAIENRAEDTRPWAIIIVTAPPHPQEVLDIRPEIRMAMCPTEE